MHKANNTNMNSNNNDNDSNIENTFSQDKEGASKWVRSLSVHEISSSWTLSDCLFFLMLSPTTQKELGAFEPAYVTNGMTEGLFRFLAVQRIIAIVYPATATTPMQNIHHLMPYRLPKGLGNAHGSYQVIQRQRLGQYFQQVSGHSDDEHASSNNTNHLDKRSASFINSVCATELKILKGQGF